jgi:hypothetical protein
MTIDIDGAVALALVTGGANDIGAATAGGARVVVADSVSFPPTGVQAA